MIIYVEKQALSYPKTKKILEFFLEAEKVIIDHYKNIFDKRIGTHKLEKTIILAKQNNPSILPTPDNYGYKGLSFFFKTSLNCVFDCKYCYLQGTFKNQFPVIFVNDEDIMSAIEDKIQEIRDGGHKDEIYFYASNYSDTQALNNLTHFNEVFIPFFEKFEDVLVESRTKSSNVNDLLEFGKVPKNLEIAFSLNPSEIISQYEIGTSKLEDRISAINKLLKKGFKVGLRFLPLLPITDYQSIYMSFLEEVVNSIDIQGIHSIFIGSLIYTLDDFKSISKKQDIELLSKMVLEENYMKISQESRIFFEELFKKTFKNKKILRDLK